MQCSGSGDLRENGAQHVRTMMADHRIGGFVRPHGTAPVQPRDRGTGARPNRLSGVRAWVACGPQTPIATSGGERRPPPHQQKSHLRIRVPQARRDGPAEKRPPLIRPRNASNSPHWPCDL